MKAKVYKLTRTFFLQFFNFYGEVILSKFIPQPFLEAGFMRLLLKKNKIRRGKMLLESIVF